MTRRKIVKIDEEKCDGCGLCVPSCAEGAIKIINGKARLVADTYCDGLGACLGHCPKDAITIVEREAEAFDEAGVAKAAAPSVAVHQPQRHPAPAVGCPGMQAMQLRLNTLKDRGPAIERPAANRNEAAAEASPSHLANWPVQLRLVQPQAPFLQNADLLLVADCVPFACADFHRRFLDGRPVVIACPKLDDGEFYVERLAQMIQQSGLRSLTVVHMEVPCCTGLVRIAQAAIAASGVAVPLHDVTISIRGEVLTPMAV